jgi:hypothetical protein
MSETIYIWVRVKYYSMKIEEPYGSKRTMIMEVSKQRDSTIN